MDRTDLDGHPSGTLPLVGQTNGQIRLAHSTIVFLIIHMMLVKYMYNGQFNVDQRRRPKEHIN